MRKVRHQLFMPRDVSDRFMALAARKGVSRSDLLATMVRESLDNPGSSEFDARLGRRLDDTTIMLDRLTRDSRIELETLALFIRYVLTVLPPLAEDDVAGKAAGAARFEVFVSQVARRFRAGERTLEPGPGQ